MLTKPTMIVLALALFVSCQTPPPDVPSQTASAIGPEWVVKQATILPPAFPRQLEEMGDKPLVVPAAMLTVTEVARPRAELRSGPGVQFELGDALLPQGTTLICFGRVGVWQRVLVRGTWQRGWVHHQSLKPPKPSAVAMVVPFNLLPTVLAVRPIASVMSYPRKEPLKIDIPTGAMFRALTESGSSVLVWLQDTNSVMWVAHNDVQ